MTSRGWKPFHAYAKLGHFLGAKQARFQMPPTGIMITNLSYYMEKWASMGVKKNVIQVSYSGDLAEDFGAKNRDKVEEFGKELFGIGLDPRQKNKSKMES